MRRPLNPRTLDFEDVTDRLWGPPTRAVAGHIPGSPCWERQGRSVGTNGYTHISIHSTLYLAHRASWAVANDRPVPDGMQVLHQCDNRLCVRPDHLRLGTHDDNMAEMVARGRVARGDRHPKRHLTLGPTCLRGHSRAVHERRTTGAKRYCKECHRLTAAARYVHKRPRKIELELDVPWPVMS